MSLFEQVYKDMLEAKKARDEFKGATISFLYAALKQFKVDNRRDPNDEDVMGVINKSVKQRRDSIEQFKNAGRTELAEKESKELEIIMHYLPKQMTEEELTELVKAEAAALKIASAKDMSKLMGAVMPKIKGKADSKLASEIIKKVVNSIQPAA
ncbi:MAG: GatB/YqeY domain-containing protein [Candidatus Wallbacteria bacterium]